MKRRFDWRGALAFAAIVALIGFIAWGIITTVRPADGREMTMQTGAAGLALIKQFEGCVLSTYRCSAGVCTIGFGHTGRDVKPGLTITADRAEELLRRDLAVVDAALERLITAPLRQHQWDGLASLVFNIGVPAFARSTMLKLLNAGAHAKAGDQFPRWNRVGKAVLPGLVKRRAAERDLFLTPAVMRG
jgi:lysozyme